MLTQHRFFTTLVLSLLGYSASAGTAAYIVTGNPNGLGEFGVMNLDTGAFRQIGSTVPGSQGLAYGPNGSLFTLAFSGALNSINPATGVSTVIFFGATGLRNGRTPPASPCGPHQPARSVQSEASFTSLTWRTTYIGLTLRPEPRRS